ncbi:MAG: IclR family transcriptional regulator [Actinobacteria bacterium]|nr:IclR family transcriptional regulator [Actinomycetota bacterium]
MTKVPSALRTLELLKLLAESPQPTTANRLAQRLGIPRSSCYQLLEVLKEQGFALHYEDQKRWGLGLAAWELGSAYQRHEPLERLSRPVLGRLVSELSQITNVVGHLGVLDGSDVLYLLEERPAKSLKLVTDIGVRLPAHLTASGRSMLAKLDQKQLAASFRGLELANRTGLGPKKLTELESVLDKERQNGFALEIDEVTMGYASVGVAIQDNLQHPIAGLAITLQSTELEKLQLSELAKALTKAASELSRKFGNHG